MQFGVVFCLFVFFKKKKIEKCLAAPRAARLGPMCCTSSREESPQFNPVYLPPSGWSPGETRRHKGSPQVKPALAAKNGVYISKTVDQRQIYFTPRQIFYSAVNLACASGDWCRSPTWGSSARPIGKLKKIPFL